MTVHKELASSLMLAPLFIACAPLFRAGACAPLLRAGASTAGPGDEMSELLTPCRCRSEPEGKFLYILPDAVTAYSMQDGAGPGGGAEPSKPPVPPCILPLEESTTQVSLEVDDRCALA